LFSIDTLVDMIARAGFRVVARHGSRRTAELQVS
jgi:hypothetical protein